MKTITVLCMNNSSITLFLILREISFKERNFDRLGFYLVNQKCNAQKRNFFRESNGQIMKDKNTFYPYMNIRNNVEGM